MIVLVKLKTISPAMYGVWLVGKKMEDSTMNLLCLSETVQIEQGMNQQGKWVFNFLSNPLITEGMMEVPSHEIILSRIVSEGELVMNEYQNTMKTYRAQKSGLIIPDQKTVREPTALKLEQ